MCPKAQTRSATQTAAGGAGLRLAGAETQAALPQTRRRGQMGEPRVPPFRFRKVLDRLDVHRLQALVALLDVELNTLSLGQ